jgi:TRAP-type C4-dicarboxylate transport system substrate-binding protein
VQKESPTVAAERYFAERVTGLTGGRYRVEVRPGGVLGDDNRVIEKVRTGRLAFGKTLLANLTAYDKRLGVTNLPYAFNGMDQCMETMAGELGRRCAGILAERGLVVLAYFYGGDRNVYNHIRPVYTPADLRGLRIRVPQNIVSIDMMNALGAAAVPMATNDIASALQQRLIAGAENSALFYVTEQHAPYARYFSWTRHQHTVDVLLTGADWLAGLPAAVREAVVEAGRLTGPEQLRLWAEATTGQIAAAERQGGATNEADAGAFRQLLAPMLREQRGTFGDLATLLPEQG